jgi:hypothetical protein
LMTLHFIRIVEISWTMAILKKSEQGNFEITMLLGGWPCS